VAVGGFGLILGAIGYELRGLIGLEAVDRLRAGLTSDDPLRRQRAARRWAAMLPEGEVLRPALDAVNDPDALLALLREGPGRRLRMEADASGRRAAVQVAAALTAVPSPGLAGLLIAWRGLRLLRQVAVLHGLRPGVLGTLGLMRRTVFAAGAVAAGEAAANAAAHALLSNPLLGRLAGDLAGAGLAARRMMVMARAAAAACSPLSRDDPP
jgi:putative membrane protein